MPNKNPLNRNWPLELPVDIAQYLQWNANINKKMVARKKVFETFFTYNFQMSSLEALDLVTKLNVVDFIGKSMDVNNTHSGHKAQLTILFCICKESPFIFKHKIRKIEKGSSKKRRMVLKM